MGLLREIDILVDFTATMSRETDRNVNFTWLQQGLGHFKRKRKIQNSYFHLIWNIKKKKLSAIQHTLKKSIVTERIMYVYVYIIYMYKCVHILYIHV